MSVIIPFTVPAARFDFELEARSAAVNEACAGTGAECTLRSLCPECEALAAQVLHRLERAFVAGQMSMKAEVSNG